MTTLFSKMVAIVGELAGNQVNENSALSSSFLEKNADDFFERDREVIQHETVAGDEYIWIVKGNGSGTSLEHSAELCAETKICVAHEKSKFFLVTCSGTDSGDVKEVSQNEALAVANKNRGFFDHRPIRQNIIDAISDYTGIDKLSLQEINLFREILSPSPNENIYLKFHFDEKMNKVIIDMAKPELVSDEADKRRHSVFLFSAKNRNIDDRVKNNDLFLKIKPCNNASIGKPQEITEEEFQRADKTAKAKPKSTPEFSI